MSRGGSRIELEAHPLIAESRAQQRARAALRHELKYSLLTSVVGLAMGAAATVLVREHHLVLETGPLSVGRCAVEVSMYVLFFDAYFYGLHRLLHTRWLYQQVHRVHHRSTSPTLLTALAFHPVEAVLIMAFMPVAMALIPIHLLSLALVSVFLFGSILVAHCGYEVFPAWWERVWLLNGYVTPKIHSAHHQRRTCNFSATLSIFDRLFGTLRREDPP